MQNELFIANSSINSSFIGIAFILLNQICLIQVHDIGNNDNINICQIRILCQWHAYGRTVGKKSCVHILFGAYSWLAALIHVPVLFPRNLCVSTLFYFDYVRMKLTYILLPFCTFVHMKLTYKTTNICKPTCYVMPVWPLVSGCLGINVCFHLYVQS